MNDLKVSFKVGSRKSELALIQTNYVVEQLQKRFPDKTFEIVTMTTTGDQILDKPLPKIGEKSLFTKELEVALFKGEVDFVVHSLKDLPTSLPDGLTVGAILRREDPRDAVVAHPSFKKATLDTLPKDSVIGTSSLRRAAQLQRSYPHLKVESIRGNLNTRLRKLDTDNKYSALVLAVAGINRMGWSSRINQILEPKELLYAVGQGALAVECRANNLQVLTVLEHLNDLQTVLKVVAERSFLQTLGGGCSAPVAVNTTLQDGCLSLTGAVWSLDGSETLQKIKETKVETDPEEPPRKCPYLEPKYYSGVTGRNIANKDLDAAFELGAGLAEELIKLGALAIIQEAKKANEMPAEEVKKMADPSLQQLATPVVAADSAT